MTARPIQLSVNVTTRDAWTPLIRLGSGAAYTVPVSARGIARSVRLINLDVAEVQVDVAISQGGTPSDAEKLMTPTQVESGETLVMDGVFVIPSGYSVFARVSGHAYYDPQSVTVHAAVLEVSE